MPEQNQGGNANQGGNQGGNNKGGGAAAKRGRADKRERRPRLLVEFGDDSNRTITIGVLRIRLRGTFSIAALFGRSSGGRDIGQAMAGMPDIPGMRMQLYDDGSCRVFDPLEEDEDLLEKVNAVLRRSPTRINGEDYKYVEATEHQLDEDQFKTLLLEIERKIHDGKCRIVKGTLPEDIEDMPGRELFDPWNNGRKPIYKDESSEWAKQVDSLNT